MMQKYRTNAVSTPQLAGAGGGLTGMGVVQEKTSVADSMLGIGTESSTDRSYAGNHTEYLEM